MLSTLRNAWKVKDLRKRILFTIGMILIYRLGNYIPVPGVDASKVLNLTSNSGSLLGFYDMISGGAFSKFSIFAMNVLPYINASIIIQLLTIAIPSLEQLSKEGEEGRKKIQKYTRYSAVVLGFLEAFGIYAMIRSSGALKSNNVFSIILIILTLTASSTFLMWIGDRITESGIGNGASFIIFTSIISRFPTSAYNIYKLQTTGIVDIVSLVVFAVAAVAIFILVVVASLAERRIPVQYAGKAAGGKVIKGQSSHIPINMNASCIIAIIFAMSVMGFPETIAQFWPTSSFAKFITGSPYSIFRSNSIPYVVVYFIAIIFFTWFYTQVTFKPEEMSENMHKSAGFIPGIRPGEPTTTYIEKVLDKISIIGGLFAGIIAIAPIIVQMSNKGFKDVYFASSGLLIVVGVATDTLRSLQSQLVMRHYHGFLK
ncbi:preprotein translocase subunit SecY [Clostridium neuense]|uniref:Protein translocase subunit SecY n=1 Tax=Clostridium neuense TaxID=1728934 RepID=A0ABW8TE04_9CLOT